MGPSFDRALDESGGPLDENWASGAVVSVIRFSGVHKAYRSDFLRRERPVLHDISFEVNPGETFAYLGHNGAGKSTTVKAMLGLIRIDAGQIEVLGAPVGSRSSLARLGYLPENPYFYDHLSAREFLQLAARLCGLRRAAASRRVDAVLELVELSARAGERLRGYSKGMLQRIGLAQALVHEPELLILDEPMGGLDPLGRAQMRRIVEELARSGKTIFLCSHILSDVEAIADRAAILSAGKLRRIVDLEEMRGTVAGYEIHCVGLSEPGLAEFGLRPSDGPGRRGTIQIPIDEQTQLPRTLARIDALGGRVLAVQPRRQSLEALFLREVAGAKPGHRPDDALEQISAMMQEAESESVGQS